MVPIHFFGTYCDFHQNSVYISFAFTRQIPKQSLLFLGKFSELHDRALPLYRWDNNIQARQGLFADHTNCRTFGLGGQPGLTDRKVDKPCEVSGQDCFIGANTEQWGSDYSNAHISGNQHRGVRLPSRAEENVIRLNILPRLDLGQIYMSHRTRIEAIVFGEVFHLDDGHTPILNLLKARSERVSHRDVGKVL